jgi:hypothetical protein
LTHIISVSLPKILATWKFLDTAMQRARRASTYATSQEQQLSRAQPVQHQINSAV